MGFSSATVGVVETKASRLIQTKFSFQKTHPRDGFSVATGPAASCGAMLRPGRQTAMAALRPRETDAMSGHLQPGSWARPLLAPPALRCRS